MGNGQTDVQWAEDWENLNGYIMKGGLGSPILTGFNTVAIPALGTDHAVWIKTQHLKGSGSNKMAAGASMSWEPWTPLGGVVKGKPVLGADADGRLVVLAIGMGGVLYKKQQTAQVFKGDFTKWGKWEVLARPTGLGTQPLIAKKNDGSLSIFVGSEAPASPAVNIWHKQQHWNTTSASFDFDPDFEIVSGGLGVQP